MAAIRSLHAGDWRITNRDGCLPTGDAEPWGVAGFGLAAAMRAAASLTTSRRSTGQPAQTAHADTAHLLPAWRRYSGTFYQHARPALAEAVATGNVVIISGVYGIVRGDEPIGWYDKILDLANWPAGLLESTLISEAHRCGAQTVVAFASASTRYAKLLRRTPGSRQASTPGWSSSLVSPGVP